MFVRSLTALSLFVGALAVTLGVSPARAECADPGSPGVDWRRCIFDRQDLQGLELMKAKLRGASFGRSNLSNINMTGADAFNAKFLSAVMPGAKLDNARLSEADFTKADLTGASMREADLRGARLFRTKLVGADLSGARLRGADLVNADLSGARWIDGKKICAEGSIGKCH
jgi:uncharacterized protein YjbI with pentapeptide repeats